MQPREPLFLNLIVTNCSSERPFTRFKKKWIKGSQCSRRGCPH